MTDRNELEEVSDGDTLKEGYYNDIFDEVRNWRASYVGDTSEGIALFGERDWTTSERITDDAGENWSAGGPGAGYDLIRVCRADRTKAIAITTAGAIKYTTDSGDNWSAPTTAPSNLSTAWSLDYVTTSVAIMTGSASSGNSIWLSTDGGDSWSQVTTGPTTVTYGGNMFDGSYGFCVDGNSNIWKTTDGAVNWTDTTYDINENLESSSKIKACTNSTFLLVGENYVEYFDGTANAIIYNNFTEGTNPKSTEIVLSDNGYYYWVTYSDEHDVILWFTNDPTDSRIYIKPMAIPEAVSAGFGSTQGMGCLTVYNNFIMLRGLYQVYYLGDE